MIETLISSKTRIKLLLKFFLNSSSRSYLRGLETEFGDSSNAIRLELNRFEKAGMLKTCTEGNKKYFQANTCLLYTSDAADDLLCVDLGGRRIIKKKITQYISQRCTSYT